MRRLTACLLAVLAASPAAAAETALERIKREGVLRWGASPSGGAPYVFTDPKSPDDVIGFEVDIAEHLARRLGVKAELVPIDDWAALPDALVARRFDLLLNGLEVTDERKEKVAFTAPYYRYRQVLTVRAADRTKYRCLDDLEGRPVGVLSGTASEGILKERGWPDRLIDGQDDSVKPYEQLRLGRVEAVLADDVIAGWYALPDPALYNVSDAFAPGVYAAAVRKEDADLLAALDAALDEMKRGGELGEIYQRWGVWSSQQRELGIARGKPQERVEAGEAAWRRIGLALLRGAGVTLLLTAVSMPLAVALGLGLALMQTSRHAWLRWPATAYVQVVRGTPLLVQIFVVYFSLPRLGEWLGTSLLTWPALPVGALCLTANYAAYEAEIHRAGLESVPKGQREAALSLGLSEGQVLWHVTLPQSFRVVLPPIVNDLISMLKDSCLVSVMGVGELLYVAQTTGKSTGHYGEMLLAAALLYLALSLLCDRLGKRLEERLRRTGAPTLGTVPAHH
jgi:polar amino acid transport system substrate-binding protein